MTPLQSPLPGEVAWYATGRFYVDGAGAIQDVGYFVHLSGLPDELFAGKPGEGTARLTFASAPFTACRLSNGDLTLALDMVGAFSLYLQDRPAATFDDPDSFARGEKIATFRRASVVVGTTVGGAAGAPPVLSLNVFSAALVWSREFALGGRRFDLRALLPHGITQWGTASATPVAAPAGFTTVVPFVGYAVAIGGPAAPR